MEHLLCARCFGLLHPHTETLGEIFALNQRYAVHNKNSVICPKSYDSYGAASKFELRLSQLRIFPQTTALEYSDKHVYGQSGECCPWHLLDFHLQTFLDKLRSSTQWN